MKVMEEVIKKINQLNLNEDWIEILDEWIRTELTYSSNSLEGNTLTLIETSIVINDKITVAGKTLREINEAINHSNALKYINLNLVKLKPSALTTNDILKLHEIVLDKIEDNKKGQYRNQQVRISGSSTILPNAYKVYDLMNDLLLRINNASTASIELIILLAIKSHFELVKIHPFVDGNGRTARLLMNTILKQFSLPPISIDPKYRVEYMQSLENSNITDYNQFEKFLLEQYSLSIDKYLKTFNSK